MYEFHYIMSAFCIYLTLPPYLAEWYAHTCRQHKYALADYCPTEPIAPLTPVELIRGSYESLVLQQWLTKQPNPTPEPIPEDANLAIEIPYFKDKDPRYYNYLTKTAKSHLAKAIANSFRIQLWEELHLFDVKLNRQDEAIFCFMEKHGISCNDTNWNAIAKIYQRCRGTYNVEKFRKNATTSAQKKSDV